MAYERCCLHEKKNRQKCCGGSKHFSSIPKTSEIPVPKGETAGFAVPFADKAGSHEVGGRGKRMIRFRPGSPAYRLIELIASCGEFPLSALGLLGDERWYRETVRRLTNPCRIRLSQTDLTGAPLILNGKGKNKSVRLRKSAFPILESIGAGGYYLHAFWEQKFPGDASHKKRNFKIAEIMAMCMGAGIEFRPYRLPVMNKTGLGAPSEDVPQFIPSRLLKTGGGDDIRKTGFTRLTGAFLFGRRLLAAYHTGNAEMKWQGRGEFKAKDALSALARRNGFPLVDSCVLFGASEEVALKAIALDDDRKHLDFRFHSIYPHIHFLPTDRNGIRLLRILTVPEWKERILDLLFEPWTRTYDRGAFQYDAKVDGVYIHSHLDADLSRLVRFRDAIGYYQGLFEVICYPFQTDFLRAMFGDRVRLNPVDLRLVEEELIPEGGESR